MINLARTTGQERRELFVLSAAQLRITPAAVEKDFWLCWVLLHIFQHPVLTKLLCFKGGTSLSKCFNLIERFSEDIDLILDWSPLAEATGQSPLARRSKTQQDKVNRAINQAAQIFIENTLVPALRKTLQPVCQVALDSDDSHTINIGYPAEFAAGYLRPQIRLEIGPLAAMVPTGSFPVTSYAAQCFPKMFAIPTASVTAIKPERTFWEKATILHAEAHRPAAKPVPARYARHYYDLYKMARSGVAAVALANPALREQVVEFKQRFYHSAWANYPSAQPGSFRLIPTEARLISLAKDYANMQEMLFGDIPSWQDIVAGLTELQVRINQQN